MSTTISTIMNPLARPGNIHVHISPVRSLHDEREGDVLPLAPADAGGQAVAADTQSRRRSADRTLTSGTGDAALVRRAADGDVHAFGLLVERYQRPMAALVSRMLENHDDVDDVMQELFLRAWKGLPRFRGDAQFSTWLYRIAVNTAIKYRSRQKSHSAQSLSAENLAGGLESLQTPVDAPAQQGGDPYRSAQRGEQEEMVRQAVLSLPEKQRVVVVLHYFEGMSCEEISGIVQCSVGTVWSRLHYACKRLKGVLEPLLAAES